MKKNRKNHHAGRMISLLLALCMVLAIAPITAFANGNTMYKRWEITANVTVTDSDGNTVSTQTITKTGDYFDSSVPFDDDDDDIDDNYAKVDDLIKAELPEGTVTETPVSFALVSDSIKYYDENDNEIKNATPGNYSYFVGYETAIFTVNITVQLSGNADQEITLVDFGNIWTNLDSTQPVAFTTELNPNTDCPNQMDITEQRWTNISDSTDTFSSNDSGDWTPTNLETYRYSITLTAKDGYIFRSKENGAFDGTVIRDGEVLSGVVLVTSGPTVSNDGKTLTVYGQSAYVGGGLQDDYVINNVVINNAPVSCTVGEAPKAMATKGDNGAYTFYEYWEEWAQTEEGLEPVKFWYSDAEQMSRVPEDKRITTFEEGKTYSYSIIAEANENYTFASQDNLSVTMNGEDYTDKSGAFLDGTGLMIGPGPFMKPTKPATQKEIELIEINNATLTFKDGDKPVFTGTTPDDAPYVLDYEGWFGEDDEFLSSSDYWNSAYVERDWCDGLISSFKANTEYTYQLYLKLTDEAAAQGYVFGPNTKLKVNGKNVEYPRLSEIGVALQIGTELTMKPTTPTTQKEIPVVEINNATLTFKDGDKPVFTGTTPDDAPYVLVFEEWRTDGEWTRSDEWFNDADHHGEDKDITAFDKDKTYNYNLYIKQNSKGWEEGWYFGPNTKLKINGKEVSFTNVDPNAIDIFMVTTGITMTPTAAGASDYKIVEGANGAWTQNTDGTLIFRANGDFSKFTGVKVDGTLIEAKNYTAVSGSTVITLKTDYLKTLSVGTHKLTVVYTDGECSTNFEVKKASSSPQTGDNSNLVLWFALLFASCAGVAGTTVYVRKKKYSVK